MSYSENYDHIDKYIKNKVNDDETLSLVSDFAILWNLYEDELYGENYKPSKLKNMIGIFDIVNRDDITSDINLLFCRLKDYIASKHSFGYSSVVNAFSIRIGKDINESELRFIMQSDSCIDKLNFLLLIAARVRNNMFHGIKGVYDLKNQKELFRVCNSVLKMAIDLKMENDT